MTPRTTSAQHLYLVRHGQTALNAEGRLRGLANPPLDETGMREALAVAEALASKGIAFVYSSPLSRAVSTAHAIATASAAPFSADERFNDRDYGPWTGHLKSEVVTDFGSVDAAPGVEPTTAVVARVRPALDAVLDAHLGRAIAVVTHDAVIRPLLAAIDAELGEVVAETGSWNELVREAGLWRVLIVDQKPEP